jgi:hypothetical protein
MRQNSKLGRKLRRLDIETLEDRYALDGNLQAFVRHGTLFITGDDAANVAELSSPASGQITVTGIDTTVNGQDTPATFTDVKSVVVRLKGGDDELTIANEETDGEENAESTPVDISKYLCVSGGDGNDTLNISANVGKGMFVRGGNGNDTINVSQTNAPRCSGISGSDGDDTVSVTDSSFRSLWVGGRSGRDTVTLNTVHASDALFAHLGRGDDTLNVSNSSAQWAFLAGGDGTNVLNNGPNNSFGRLRTRGF